MLFDAQKHLSPSAARDLIGLIRFLDKVLADDPSMVYETDYNFLCSMKDWVDRANKPISFKQEKWVRQIGDKVATYIEVDPNLLRPTEDPKYA